MSQKPASRDFTELLELLLEIPAGAPRLARLRDFAGNDAKLEEELRKHVVADETPVWFDNPEEISLSPDWLDAMTQEGSRFGEWRITGPLAMGGMGGVYSATRAVEGAVQRGALKLLHRHIDVDQRVRLQAELKVLTQVAGHPNIVQLIDAGVTEEGWPIW